VLDSRENDDEDALENSADSFSSFHSRPESTGSSNGGKPLKKKSGKKQQPNMDELYVGGLDGLLNWSKGLAMDEL